MRFFSLDVHISVINDVKNILKNIYEDKIDFVDWTLSFDWHLMYKTRPYVKYITGNTWRYLDPLMIKSFVEEYRGFLSTFDGFIVTHNPSFALLYESFNKPIIIVNTCRYEQPYSFSENNDLNSWRILNNKLKYLYDTGRITVISNNRADQEYLEMGTGIKSTYIPSLCEYTNAKYNPEYNVFVIHNDSHFLRKSIRMIPVKNYTKKPYSWQTLYSCKGMIHMPYQISTMSTFEQYTANVPLFFPSKELMKEMLKTNKYDFCARYIDIDKHKSPNRVYISEVATAYDNDKWIDWWIDRADYYNTDKDTDMKYITYFNSMDELDYLLEITNTAEISDNMKKHNEFRKKKIYEEWKKIMDKFIN